MRISILLPDFRGGGAERVMLNLAREFSHLGHEVEFVLMEAKGDFLTEARTKFSVIDLNALRTRQVPLALAKYLRNRGPDVVIANIWPLTSAAVIGRMLARHQCVLLLLEHNTLTRQYASWGRIHAGMMAISIAATYRFADVVAAVSKGAAKDVSQLARLSNERVQVLNNPIPHRKMPSPKATANAEAIWNCPPGQRILTVGSLQEQKNQPLLLHAFAKLRRPDSRLMLVGQGSDEDSLRALAGYLGIADRVIFTGFQPNPSAFYASADMFALSSNYEGLPTVLIEALSFGLPVVSTDCPSGPAEILKDGRFGQLVSVGDETALTEAIDAALAKPVDPELLHSRAADFLPEVCVKRYLDLIVIED